jgi:hypothetical protein
MIFADSLPLAKSFFAAAQAPASTVGLLTRFVVACLTTLRCCAQAADSIRIDPRHRSQLVRFLARRRWVRVGWVNARKLATPGGHWVIWADEDELARMRQLWTCSRGWSEDDLLAKLTKPKERNSK